MANHGPTPSGNRPRSVWSPLLIFIFLILLTLAMILVLKSLITGKAPLSVQRTSPSSQAMYLAEPRSIEKLNAHGVS